VKNLVDGTDLEVFMWGTWNDRHASSKNVTTLAKSLRQKRTIMRAESAMPVFLNPEWLDDPFGYQASLKNTTEKKVRELQLSQAGIEALKDRHSFIIDQGNHRRLAAAEVMAEDAKTLEKMAKAKEKGKGKEKATEDEQVENIGNEEEEQVVGKKSSKKVKKESMEVVQFRHDHVGYFMLRLLNFGTSFFLHH
jgi:hypothetical protein